MLKYVKGVNNCNVAINKDNWCSIPFIYFPLPLCPQWFIIIAIHKSIQMKSLDALLKELESKLPLMEKQNPAVSEASVGWHIEHSLLAAIKMINAVAHSEPDKYRWRFNWRRSMVFATGRIPRGKAKAPKAVVPESTADAATITAQFATLRDKLQNMSMLKPQHFFEHPFFGPLHVKHTFKVIQLHTQHHIKIINDIIASAKP